LLITKKGGNMKDKKKKFIDPEIHCSFESTNIPHKEELSEEELSWALYNKDLKQGMPEKRREKRTKQYEDN
jgi:hypothetical protein